MNLRFWFRYFLLILFVLLAGTEIGLRLLRWQPESLLGWVVDAEFGHRGPRSEKRTYGDRPIEVLYNEHGFRSDWLNTPPKPPGSYSLLMLGDSMMESNMIERALTFPVVAARHWEKITGRSAFLNTFAIADSGTTQAWLALNNHGKAVQPDRVVLQFLGLNDFVNNGFRLAQRNQSRSDRNRPYVDPARSKDDALFLAYPHPLLQFSLQWSALARVLYSLQLNREWIGLYETPPPPPNCTHELELFLEERSPPWNEAILATTLLFRSIARTGPSPLALYLPSVFELNDEFWTNQIVPNLSRCFPGKKFSRRAGEETFLAAAKAAGLSALSLWPAFDMVSQENLPKLFLENDGHFSPSGHRLVGEYIGELLSKPISHLDFRPNSPNLDHQ
jgi:hypothetical protein